jgi:hypothetical protein
MKKCIRLLGQPLFISSFLSLIALLWIVVEVSLHLNTLLMVIATAVFLASTFVLSIVYLLIGIINYVTATKEKTKTKERKIFAEQMLVRGALGFFVGLIISVLFVIIALFQMGVFLLKPGIFIYA